MDGRTHHIDFPMALPLRLTIEVSCIGDRPVHISAIQEYEFRIPRKYESVSKGFFDNLAERRTSAIKEPDMVDSSFSHMDVILEHDSPQFYALAAHGLPSGLFSAVQRRGQREETSFMYERNHRQFHGERDSRSVRRIDWIGGIE